MPPPFRIHVIPFIRAFLQRLPGILLTSLVPFSFLGPTSFPYIYYMYYAFLKLCTLINAIRTTHGLRTAYHQVVASSQTDWCMKYRSHVNNDSMGKYPTTQSRENALKVFDDVRHVIVIPNFKEDLGTLKETLDVLASHARAKSQYTVGFFLLLVLFSFKILTHLYQICLAMEETEPNAESKALHLIQLYSPRFSNIVYTLHPKDLPGEIRGKSSNVSWAVSNIAKLFPTHHDLDIVTVMDADTCFAEDYFCAVTYHFCMGESYERDLMMFAPLTLFDRNADSVPVLVRATDIGWSVGVSSNLYRGSPVKIPCSAYSVSMNLVKFVEFWCTGPEAIGEDMHMLLKVFVKTRGNVIVHSIYSPASQCNVTVDKPKSTTQDGGSSITSSIWYYFADMSARYSQAKRHLWGSLDSGWLLAKLLEESCFQIHDNPQSQKFSWQIGKTLHLIHRVLEVHILMVHYAFLIFSHAIITLFGMIMSDGSTWTFKDLLFMVPGKFLPASQERDPFVSFMTVLCDRMGLFTVICFGFMVFYYEKYHYYAAFKRWEIQREILDALRFGNHIKTTRKHKITKSSTTKKTTTTTTTKSSTTPYEYIQKVTSKIYHYRRRTTEQQTTKPMATTTTTTTSAMKNTIIPSQMLTMETIVSTTTPTIVSHKKSIHHLGIRSGLQSIRLGGARFSFRGVCSVAFDWIMFLVAGFLFYLVPAFEAQISHFWTNRLDYKVAGKPVVTTKEKEIEGVSWENAPEPEKEEKIISKEIVNVIVKRKVILNNNPAVVDGREDDEDDEDDDETVIDETTSEDGDEWFHCKNE